MTQPVPDHATTAPDHLTDRTRELLALNAIAAAVAQSLEPLPLLVSALDHVLDLLDLDAGAIYTHTEQRLEQIVYRGIEPAIAQEYATLALGHPYIGRIVAERRSLVINDVRATPLQSLATEAGLHSLLGIPLFARGDVVGVLVVLRASVDGFSTRQITLLEAIADHIALALDNARLFTVEQQRRQQAETLRIAAAAVASSLDLGAVLETILAQLQRVVVYSSATVQLREHNAVRIIAARGIPEVVDPSTISFPLTDAYPNRRVIEDAETVLLADAPAEYANFRAPSLQHIRSWLGVPLCYGGRAIGMLTLDRPEPAAFASAEVQLVTLFAQQAALAIENARLFAAEQQRRRQSEALRKGALALTEALGPDAVLRRIMQQATELMETPQCALYELEPGTQRLQIRSARETFGNETCGAQLGQRIVEAAIHVQHAVSVSDITDPRPQPQIDLADLRAADVPFRSVLAAPLLVKGRVYGGIAVFYTTPRIFSADDHQLIDIFADQAALAIEHARLVDQSRQLAALEERQRIARDLHDSVSQTLFSLTLAAQAARTTSSADPAAADSLLATVQELATGALAEMRALIFELRPGALHEAGLAAAIERFVGAFRSRTGIAVVLDLEHQRLAPATEEALYRITGEALANVGKHACASSVTIALHHAPEEVVLIIHDDGVGFDPHQPITGDHLGQRTMQERAAALGGSCAVRSAPNQGTTVTVRVPQAQSEHS